MPKRRRSAPPPSGFTEPGYSADSARRPRVVVIGGANTDYLIRAARLPRPGETVTGEEFDHAEAGGKGANQAVAAARLGAQVTFIGRIGADDRGRALLRRLRAEGVNVRHVIQDPRNHTGVAQISVDATGEKQILVAPGANQRLTPADIRRPAVAKAIASADILILQFEVPLPANLAAARLANRAGVPIVLDPAPALAGEGGIGDLGKGRTVAATAKKQKSPEAAHLPCAISHRLSALLRAVTVLRANEHEAEALTGIRVKNRQTAQKAAQHLLEKYGTRNSRSPHALRATIITAGQGNLAVWREENRSIHYQLKTIHCLYLPRLQVKAIDSTGAGDAFAAALAVALAEGHPVPTAAHFANAVAALTTTQLGAQTALPRRSAVLALQRSR